MQEQQETTKLVSVTGRTLGHCYKGIAIRKSVIKARTRRTSQQTWKIAKADIYGKDHNSYGIHFVSFRTLAEAKEFIDNLKSQTEVAA